MTQKRMPVGMRPEREPGDRRVRVAAVVVTYNRKGSLGRTLEALRAQSRPVDEIVVVDNASHDGTAGMLRDEFPDVVHLRMESNGGASGGFACGMRYALQGGHDWVWLFGDDQRPTERALQVLLDEAEGYRPDALGMITGWLQLPDGTPVARGWLWRDRLVRQALPSLGSQPYPTDLLIFNGNLIRSAAVASLGIPRVEYFMGWEEFEYCLRLRRAGYQLVVVPRPLIVSEDPVPDGNARPPWRGYYQARNQLAMALEDGSPSEVFWWAIRQGKLLLGTLLWLDRKGERIRLRLLGAWHGFRRVTGRTVEP